MRLLKYPEKYIRYSIRMTLLTNLDTFYVLDSLLCCDDDIVVNNERLESEDINVFISEMENIISKDIPISRVNRLDYIDYEVMSAIFLDSYYHVHIDEISNGVDDNHLSEFVYDYMNMHITSGGLCSMARASRLNIITGGVDFYNG